MLREMHLDNSTEIDSRKQVNKCIKFQLAFMFLDLFKEVIRHLGSINEVVYLNCYHISTLTCYGSIITNSSF
jgi:hypothetical protein